MERCIENALLVSGGQVWHTRHQLERGDMRVATSMVPQLQRRNACVASLRRFLGYRSVTKWEREASVLLDEIMKEEGPFLDKSSPKC